MPNDVVHFAISADDCERAKKFYETVFGWKFEAWGPPGFWLIQTSPNASVRGALQKRKAKPTGLEKEAMSAPSPSMTFTQPPTPSKRQVAKSRYNPSRSSRWENSSTSKTLRETTPSRCSMNVAFGRLQVSTPIRAGKPSGTMPAVCLIFPNHNDCSPVRRCHALGEVSLALGNVEDVGPGRGHALIG